MKEERLKILEMLEQGKINADEASQLLEQFKANSNEGSVLDWFKNSIAVISGYRQQVEFESSPAGNGIKSINMQGKNANVSLKAYEGLTLKVKCEYISKIENPQIALLEENGVFELSYNEDEIRSMEIKCYVPKVLVEKALIASGNGRLSIEGINCNELEAATTNGKIKAEKTLAQTAQLITTNGSIKLEKSAIVKAHLQTSNGSIKVEDPTPWEQEHRLEARTTNGSIVVELPAEVGIKLDAKTTNGSIRCNSVQGQNTKGYIGKSLSGQNQLYDSAVQKVVLDLSTTNGSVKVLD